MIFWVIFLLLLIGLVFIVLEAVLPYGISMIVGIGLIIGSMVLCFKHYGPGEGTLYLVMALPVASLLVYWVTRSGVRWLALRPPQREEAHTAVSGPPVGERVEVIQPLRPTGTIRWGKRRLAARTLRPETETESGHQVVVKGVDSIYVLVEPAEAATDRNPSKG